MEEYSAYRSAELAALYDAVYADAGDIAFWEATAAALGHGPILELGCGTGRVLLPLARAGYEVVGVDRATHMLACCSEKLRLEPPEVQGRVTLLEADITSFEMECRFSLVFCAFGTFHHLRTVEEQLACLERCRHHLLPGGTLVLDLINPDPAPGLASEEELSGGDTRGVSAEWSEGQQVRASMSVLGCQRALQCNDCEVTYEIVEAGNVVKRLSETFPMRFIFRYELEHLLARSGFRIAAWYGDYDRSVFADDSLEMIVVAEPWGGQSELVFLGRD